MKLFDRFCAKKIFSLALLFLTFTSISFAQNTKPDALALYRNGNYLESIKVCEDELAANPNNMESYCVLCWALIANGQYREAEQMATEARKINARDVRLIESLGEAKYYLGKNNEALNLFQRYVANASENADRLGRVYYLTGEIYIKQARYEHADISFSTAVRYEPAKSYWWTRLGYAKEMASDWQNAVIAYDRALSLDPSQNDAVRGKTRCQSRIN